MLLKKIQNRLARKRRIRARITGTRARPRLSVNRSLSGIYVQLIDDTAGRTVVSASTKELKVTSNMDGAVKLGKLVAEKAKKSKIQKIVFDRSGYQYHGRVKALAEAAREGGLVF